MGLSSAHAEESILIAGCLWTVLRPNQTKGIGLGSLFCSVVAFRGKKSLWITLHMKTPQNQTQVQHRSLHPVQIPALPLQLGPNPPVFAERVWTDLQQRSGGVSTVFLPPDRHANIEGSGRRRRGEESRMGQRDI